MTLEEHFESLKPRAGISDLIGCELMPGLSIYSSKSADDFPPNPIEAGKSAQGEMIYVGFGEYGDRNLKDVPGKYDCGPAKINKMYQTTFYPYGGKEHPTTNHIFLCIEPGFTYKWVKDSSGHVPPDAIRLGRKSNGENYFVGRHFFRNENCVGKISPSEKLCYIGFGLVEVKTSNYNVLVVNKGEDPKETTGLQQIKLCDCDWSSMGSNIGCTGQFPDYYNLLK